MYEDLLIGFNGLLAGVALLAGLLCLWVYRRGSMPANRWALGLLGMAAAASLLGGAVVMGRPHTSLYESGLFLRATAYGIGAVLAVWALTGLTTGLRVRVMVWVLTLTLAVRTAVWLPTDLIVEHPLHAGRWPVYGPLGWTEAIYGAGLAVVGAQAFFRGDRLLRWLLAFAVPVTAVLSVWSIVRGGGAIYEEAVVLAVVPAGVAVLLLAAAQIERSARLRELLVDRQTTLTRLGHLAMHAEDIETLRREAEFELRRHLGRDHVAVEILPAPPLSEREPQPEDTTAVTVQGRGDVVRALDVDDPGPDARHFVESVLQIVVASRDRFAYDAELARRATHDDLTGLPNRVLFLDRLAGHLSTHDETHVVVYVVAIGGLGELASVAGLEARDVVIAVAADALDHLVEPTGTLAALSTGTFGVIERVSRTSTAAALSARLIELDRALSARLRDAGQLRAAIGAVAADRDIDAEQMLRNAMAAVGRAIANGGGVQIYGDALRTQVDARASLHSGLQYAIERNELDLRYQPIVAARSRQLVGYEALGRWRRDGAVVPPGEWVPVAEHGGLIREIGTHLLALACREQPDLDCPVSVNVSPIQLTAAGFADSVRSVLGRTPPEMLVLEVTESAVMTDQRPAVDALDDLRADGVRIALDDFGTSYSSLSMLIDLPVDILKIDRSFVERLDTASGRSVVEAVVTLARTLEKITIAEGVETDWQADMLAEIGVDNVQGFAVGRPVSLDRLRTGRARPAPGPDVDRPAAGPPSARR